MSRINYLIKFVSVSMIFFGFASLMEEVKTVSPKPQEKLMSYSANMNYFKNSKTDYLASDKVPGFKEGEITVDSVFVFVSEDCAFCYQYYLDTREMVKNGTSIKWIPVKKRGGSSDFIERFVKEGPVMLAKNKKTPNIVLLKSDEKISLIEKERLSKYFYDNFTIDEKKQYVAFPTIVVNEKTIYGYNLKDLESISVK